MKSLKGLSSLEATYQLNKFGPNAIPVPKNRLAKLVLRQFKGIFNLPLIAAAGVTFTLGADKLKSYLMHTITVLRDGEAQEIITVKIVPGYCRTTTFIFD